MKTGCLCLCIVCLAGFVAQAKILYVDDDNYNPAYETADDYIAAGFDGSTEAKAFGTIQAALDKTTSGTPTARNEVIVLPGVYDKGFVHVTYGTPAVDCGNFRVKMTGSYVTLRSRDGKEVTHIVGAKDPETADGRGPNAIAGIANYWVRGSMVQGFTIRDCAVQDATTDDSDATKCRGAAVHTMTPDAMQYVADCVISNCVSKRGIVQRGCFFRTLFCDNTSIAGIAQQAELYSCILTGNGRKQKGDVCTAGGSYLVNCTIVGNGTGYATTAISDICNSIVLMSGNGAANSIAEKFATGCGNVSPRTHSDEQLIAPMFGDFRVLKGAAAETAGDPRFLDAAKFPHVAQDWFPRDELYKDFYGNPIPTDGETVMAGAIQQTATPAGGALRLTMTQSSVPELEVNGHLVVSKENYAYPTTYPVQWSVKPRQLAANRFFRGVEGEGYDRAVPGQTDETAWLMPPPAVTSVATAEVVTVTYPKVYVDDANGNDETADGTEAHPFQTIQGALLATNEATVMVKPGWYDKGGYFFHGISNRVCIADGTFGHTKFAIVSTDGPEKTFIVGAADPDYANDPDAPGCGPKAVRCVNFYTGQKPLLRGFTLVNGHTGRVNADSAYHGAAINVSAGASQFFADLVISNCTAHTSIMNGGTLVRSRMRDSHSHTYGLHLANARACEFSGITAKDSFFAGNTRFQSHVSLFGVDTGTTIFNSQFLYNSIIYGGFNGGSVHYGNSLFWNWSKYVDGMKDVIREPPFCLDPAAGDFRILTGSPAVGAGVVPTDENYANYYKYAQGDVENKPLVFTNGRPTVGARQTAVPGVGVYVTAASGGLEAVGATLGAETVLPAGASVTVGMAASGDRPCPGFTLNGVTNLFENGAARTFTCGVDWSDGVYQLEAVYAPHWYVNPNGSDVNNGFTAATPLRTLAAACAKAVAGDTVHAAPGTYAEGEVLALSSHAIPSRVYVKTDVTLVGDEGPEKTVIRGELDTETPDVLEDERLAQFACGPKAMRCAYVGTRGLLKGFTITGGRTRGSVEGYHHYSDDYSGGGVLGTGDQSQVVDCIISNNVAYRGGGARYVYLKKCRVSGNSGLYMCGSAGESSAFGCVFDRNFGGGIYQFGKLDDCTFANDLDLWGKNVTYPFTTETSLLKEDGTGPHVRNCAVRGTVPDYQPQYRVYANTYATAMNVAQPSDPALTIVSVSALGLGDDLRPSVPGSVLLDRADTSLDLAGADYATDASGFQRVMNGARDVGALEGDWRAAYAADIARPRAFSVTAASANVVETDAKTVRVPNGETLSARWTNAKDAERERQVTVRLTGVGALTVTLNGELLRTVTAEGETTFAFSNAFVANDLTFAYAGEGSAEIVSSRTNIGQLILLR